jgi:tripeptide aminopeptidase
VSLPATAPERARLNDLFAELCRIESPFGHERACADRVAAELRDAGLEVAEDDAGPVAGSECGNLLARIGESGEARTVLLCAHLDTVVPQAPIEPVLVEGAWENARDGILGADNKAAVAVMLVLARRLMERPQPLNIELLFTVCEENALRGAKAFDVSRLRSEFGYVFDHATPIGEVIVASPTYYRLEADFHGAAAHAGIRPEEGRSAIAAAAAAVAAMRLGRIDEATTANVGRIEGGSASTNVVPERCRVEAECRSLEDAAAEMLVAEMVDHVHDGANAHECDVEVSVERLFQGYRAKPSSPAVIAAEAALRRCGHEPRRVATGGGSDANALVAAGFPCVNLANGTQHNHEPGERVTVDALEGMLDVAIALLDEAREAH